MRYLILILALLLGLIVVTYGAIPWLARWLGPELAPTLGLRSLEVEAGYPGPGSLSLPMVAASLPGLEIRAEDLRLEYAVGSLGAGRLREVRVGSLLLRVSAGALAGPAPVERGEEPPQGEAAAAAPAPEALLALIPADRVRLDSIRIEVPERALEASGRFALEPAKGELMLSVSGPPLIAPLLLTTTLDAGGAVHIGLMDDGGMGPSSLSVQGTVSGDVWPVDGELVLAGSLLSLLQDLLDLPAGTGVLAARLHTSLPWPPLTVPDWRSLTGSGNLHLDWALPDGSLAVEALQGSFQAADGVLDARLSGQGRLISGEDVLLTTVTDGEFRLDGSAVTSSAPGAVISVEAASLSALLGLADFRLDYGGRPRVALSGTLEGAWEEYTLDGQLAAGSVVGGEAYSGEARFQGRFAGYPVDLDGTWELAGQDIHGTGRLASGPLFTLPWILDHHLESASGNLVITEHRLRIGEPLLETTVPDWEEAFDLDSGDLALSGALRWAAGELAGSASIRPVDVSALVDDYRMEGISGEIGLVLSGADWRLEPSTLGIAAIDVGFPVTDIDVEVSGDEETLHFQRAAARTLGGTLHTGPFAYRVAEGEASLAVTLTDLDLAAVLALEGDDIAGTGRLSGEVPVRLVGNVPSVEGGLVRATGPGTIRLAPALASAISQPGLDVALRALGNYAYEVLETRVDYQAGGDLLLGIRLEGRNPEVEGGRPVHYNLNISENIPVLLQSLRMSEAVGEQVEKAVIR